jgi:hypothetical protein
MKSWLQRLRGALGIGLTWAVAWAPLGAIAGWVTASAFNFHPAGDVIANFAIAFSVLGLAGGAIFSTVLGIAERRRSFARLSLARFSAWGAVGGLILGGLATMGGFLGAGVTVLGAAIVGGATLLGAASAATTLAVARASDDPRLPSGGASERIALPNDASHPALATGKPRA